jgi:hypothetical protein
MAKVYLYKYKEYVQLTQADKNVPNINLPMITYNTKVYKGATNTIDFIIRNNDRKAVRIIGLTLIAQIRPVNQVTNAKNPPDIILEKELVIVDETKGKAKLVLAPNEIEDWQTGSYRYTVKTINQDNETELLFTDINKETWNSFELVEGIASSLTPPVEVMGNKFTETPVGWDWDTKMVTGAIPGDAQEERASGTHTVTVYTNKWLGKFWIEGCLANEPPAANEWFRIPIGEGVDYYEFKDDKKVGTTLFNFTMNLYWIRFVYQPTLQNKGKFTKILYKN